ncbi:hypothetical protein ACWODM_11830, partial [Enterococcus olivae]
MIGSTADLKQNFFVVKHFYTKTTANGSNYPPVKTGGFLSPLEEVAIRCPLKGAFSKTANRSSLASLFI